MKQYLFLGDSITDADHLFDPANLGYGYVSLLARRPEYVDARFVNRGHEGFTIERVLQMLRRVIGMRSPSLPESMISPWNFLLLTPGFLWSFLLFTGKCWIFYASILPPSCYWNRFFLMNRQNTPPGIRISKKKARSSTIWHSLILLILSRRTQSSDRQLARKESMRSRPTGFI
mgnify:CR=1 FL=1